MLDNLTGSSIHVHDRFPSTRVTLELQIIKSDHVFVKGGFPRCPFYVNDRGCVFFALRDATSAPIVVVEYIGFADDGVAEVDSRVL